MLIIRTEGSVACMQSCDDYGFYYWCVCVCGVFLPVLFATIILICSKRVLSTL